MNPELWRRAKPIFEAALARPASEREGFFDRECGGDRALRRSLEALLAADAADDDLLATPPVGEMLQAVAEERDQSWLKRALGPYRLVRRIAEGGMGSVFLAERVDAEYHKQVAVKVIRTGMDSEESRRRFRIERQVLAVLDHPNIARLLDGGTTEEGLPYLVMEYVDGLVLTTYCDRERLSVRARLELFRAVCAAVVYAHRNLVVHRDLKASNILVTEDGVPKLLDFGIAKLLDASRYFEEPTETRTAARVLTPDYASPEQVTGGAITTASDVYSLGVLLYELLTGRRPFSWAGRSPSQIEEVLLTEDPNPLSAVVARPPESDLAGSGAGPEAVAAARGTRPEVLRRQLAGDLDNIVMRALRKEPERRYATVQQLSEDLRRHLEGLPVEARPSRLGYRAGKFVRRHAAAVAVSSTIALMGLGLLVTTLVQSRHVVRERDLARRQQAKAEEVTRLLVQAFEQADPEQNRGEVITAREILDIGARRILQSLEDQPETRTSLMHVIGKVYSSVGLYDQARPLLERSLEIRRRLYGERDPRVAESYHQWGVLSLQQGDYEDARHAARQALEIRRAEGSPETGESLHLLASVESAQGDRDSAIRRHEEALEHQHRLYGPHHREHARSLDRLAMAVRAQGDRERAEDLFRQALAVQRGVAWQDDPVNADILYNLAFHLESKRELEEAEQFCREALEMNRRLYGDEHPAIASNLNLLAAIELRRGRVAEAEALFRETLAMRRRLLGPGHRKLAHTIYNLALLLHRDLGRAAEAEELYRDAVAIYDDAVGGEHPNLGFFLRALGEAVDDQGRPREAEPILRRSLEIFLRSAKHPERNTGVAASRSALAGALLSTKRYGEAEELLVSAYPVLEAGYGSSDRLTRRALRRLVELYRETGRPQEAARYEKAVAGAPP